MLKDIFSKNMGIIFIKYSILLNILFSTLETIAYIVYNTYEFNYY